MKRTLCLIASRSLSAGSGCAITGAFDRSISGDSLIVGQGSINWEAILRGASRASRMSARAVDSRRWKETWQRQHWRSGQVEREMREAVTKARTNNKVRDFTKVANRTTRHTEKRNETH